ncbi:MAG: (2Fe-2S) ferredoxin domain-containing protein [Eubacteriales bacterium]|nr:(2Fe-2S) ferredoxin domain-containing protein [Eubacteriales bacterium]
MCVGTSCHLKGSHHAINKLAELIKEYGLENEVELKASFCMDRCEGDAIAAEVDGRPVYDMTEQNVDEVFRREILGSGEI